MWSSDLLRIGLLSLAMTAPIALSGCTGLRPVYGETGVAQERLAIAYAKPATRTDQIIIQDLILRLGSTRSTDAPLLTVTTGTAARAVTRTNVVKPSRQYEMTVTASFTLVANGETVLEGTRKAIATYSTNGQVLADEAASKDAIERAAHEVADTIRLTILGRLAAPVPAGQ